MRKGGAIASPFFLGISIVNPQLFHFLENLRGVERRESFL
jgi:hypothetical protein